MRESQRCGHGGEEGPGVEEEEEEEREHPVEDHQKWGTKIKFS